MRRPRTLCPRCRGWVALRKDGTFYAHQRQRPGYHFSPAPQLEPCPGSGVAPDAAPADNMEGAHAALDLMASLAAATNPKPPEGDDT